MAWRFLFIPELCLGCRSCEMACRSEFAGQDGQRWRWVTEAADDAGGQGYFLSLSCNHCENPECIRLCAEETYRKRRDGIVVHDPRRCSGCGRCVKGCPFSAPKLSLRTGHVDKCNLCIHRVDNGRPAACVEACPVSALSHLFPNEAEPQGTVLEFGGFHNIQNTKPSIRFLQLRHRQGS